VGAGLLRPRRPGALGAGALARRRGIQRERHVRRNERPRRRRVRVLAREAVQPEVNLDGSKQFYGSSDADPESSQFWMLYAGFDWY
jgi:hypothetical protein